MGGGGWRWGLCLLCWLGESVGIHLVLAIAIYGLLLAPSGWSHSHNTSKLHSPPRSERLLESEV